MRLEGFSNLTESGKAGETFVLNSLLYCVGLPSICPASFRPQQTTAWSRWLRFPHVPVEEVCNKTRAVVALVLQSGLHNLARYGVQHRQRLLASVQITSYNSHLGLLRSELCRVEHRTVYSGRREAGIVKPSIRVEVERFVILSNFGVSLVQVLLEHCVMCELLANLH